MFYETPNNKEPNSKDFSFRTNPSQSLKKEDLKQIVNQREILYKNLHKKNEQIMNLEKYRVSNSLKKTKSVPMSPYKINRSIQSIEKDKDNIKQQISFLNSKMYNSHFQDNISPVKFVTSPTANNLSINEIDNIGSIRFDEKEKEIVKKKEQQISEQTKTIQHLQMKNSLLQEQLKNTKLNLKQVSRSKKPNSTTRTSNTSSISSYFSNSAASSMPNTAKGQPDLKSKFKDQIESAKMAVTNLTNENETLTLKLQQQEDEYTQKLQNLANQNEILQMNFERESNELQNFRTENQNLLLEITDLKQRLNIELESRTQDMEKIAPTMTSLTQQLQQYKEIAKEAQDKNLKYEEDIILLKTQKKKLEQELKEYVQEIQNSQSIFQNSQFQILNELSSLNTTNTNSTNILTRNPSETNRSNLLTFAGNNPVEKELFTIIKSLQKDNDSLQKVVDKKTKKIDLLERNNNNMHELQVSRDFEEHNMKNILQDVQYENKNLKRQLASEYEKRTPNQGSPSSIYKQRYQNPYF